MAKWYRYEKQATGWDVYKTDFRKTWAGTVVWLWGGKKPQYAFNPRSGGGSIAAGALEEMSEFLRKQTKKRRKAMAKEQAARGEAS